MTMAGIAEPQVDLLVGDLPLPQDAEPELALDDDQQPDPVQAELATLRQKFDDLQAERLKETQAQTQASSMQELYGVVQSIQAESEQVRATLDALGPTLTEEERTRLGPVAELMAVGKMMMSDYGRKWIAEKSDLAKERQAWNLTFGTLGPNTTIARAQEFHKQLMQHDAPLMEQASKLYGSQWREGNVRQRAASGVERIETGGRFSSGGGSPAQIWSAYGRGELSWNDPRVRAAGKALGAL